MDEINRAYDAWRTSPTPHDEWSAFRDGWAARDALEKVVHWDICGIAPCGVSGTGQLSESDADVTCPECRAMMEER